MGEVDSNSDDWCEGGCQRSAGHAQAKGKHEDVIHYDIKNAACNGCNHGDGWRTIVAHKSGTDVITHEKRGEPQKDL